MFLTLFWIKEKKENFLENFSLINEIHFKRVRNFPAFGRKYFKTEINPLTAGQNYREQRGIFFSFKQQNQLNYIFT